MNYSIRTISQLPLILKGFRKERGLTQAAMAERLGVTQQSYAYFETNPAAATMERLFIVLRILGVEIILGRTDSTAGVVHSDFSLKDNNVITKAPNQRLNKASKTGIVKKGKLQTVIKPNPIISAAQKKENW